jgi:hypothetical protein
VGVRRKQLSSVLLLCAVCWVAGCASEIETPDEQPGFSSLPASCSKAMQPLESAVRDFAGDLYDSPVRGDGDELSRENPYTQSLTCEARYLEALPRAPIGSARMPMTRSVGITYGITTLPQYSDATTTAVRAQVPEDDNNSTPVQLSGIGEDAVTWVERDGHGDVHVSVRFRLGNLDVGIRTSGMDWPATAATMPSGKSPELQQDLQSGAESIAAAVAGHVESALPKAMLTWPTDTSAASSPATTTTSAPKAPLWDPCRLPDSAVAAAGLAPSTKKPEGGPDRPSCEWSGEWFDIRIDSPATTFESEIYHRETYVRPEFVTPAGRPALMFTWADTEYFCDVAFEIAGEPGSYPQLVIVEATAHEDDKGVELCGELGKVTEAVAGAIPVTR